ncbi:hypothetical protein [Taibaiella chishuiensis]|uniref:Uncharacterized protein n=1 Tax=Taibaiella chishuiensis TaxID=1434707 RepID=A0A2P8D4I4_9BACT|nr:hypothetical protein [Taibaiella chishuiensis]PSK92123.1 hypothetical protein B0I18_104221 [Taibaiella chishuiensis]
MNRLLLIPALLCVAACSDSNPGNAVPEAGREQGLVEQRYRESEYADSVIPLAHIPSAITDALAILRKKEDVLFPDDKVVFRKIDHSRLFGGKGDYLQVIRSGYRFRFWYKSELIAIEYWLLDGEKVVQFENCPDYNDRFYVAGYFCDGSNSTTFHSCSPEAAVVIRYPAAREFKQDDDVIRCFLLDCGCY